MSNIVAYKNQSPFDIALQQYGSIEGVIDLLSQNPTMELDTDLDSGDLVSNKDATIQQQVVDFYTKYTIQPATGDTEKYLQYFESDYGMITRTYNYAIAGGDKTFDGILLYNLNGAATIQINYSNINTSDVRVEIESSLDGVSFSTLYEAIYTLDKTKPSHTFMLMGLVTKYIRLKVYKGTATAGTIDNILIAV